MRSCPPGWATDLAILEHTGSVVEDHGDHLVARSPHHPDFHWGNFVLVTDEDTVDDAGRWVGAFHEAFPDADWVAIGLPRMPVADGRLGRAGAGPRARRRADDTRPCPAGRRPPTGTRCGASTAPDWEQDLARALADNVRSDEHDPTVVRAVRAGAAAHPTGPLPTWTSGPGSARSRTACSWPTSGSSGAARVARYQDVTTDEPHRRRGLASHLLGVAAQWAADGGCEQWVIVTEATNPAGRVYRSLGFAPDTGMVQAYRTPPR